MATALTTHANWLTLLNSAIELVCYVVRAGNTACGADSEILLG
jgi:hypothetical protein